VRADTYADMHAVEGAHWWFVARRRILRNVLTRFAPAGALRILEAGCGTGGNLAMLASLGQVTAFEPNAEARALASATGVATVTDGYLPGPLSLSGPFDMVCAFDVIEHLDSDEESCRALRERIAPGGVGVFTVPAFSWMWSQHDVIMHHKRRYTRTTFNDMLRRAGFEVVYTSYFNTLLFPAVAAARGLQKLLRIPSKGGDTASLPPRPINAVLARIFGAESLVLPAGKFPVGVSIISVVRPITN
jgi:SAM-dependent methyltransferase